VTLAVVRKPNSEPRFPAAYWRLWWAAAADNIGDGAFAAAVPLLAVTITRDPLLISLVGAATYLPWLLLSVPAGAIIDRRDKVSLMWRSQAVQGVVVAIVTALAVAGHVTIPVLAAMGFVLGACEVVFANASQAILPELVPAGLLHRANSAQYAVGSAGQVFVGPPVGSLLFAIASALPFGLDAGSFGLSAGLLAGLPRSRPARADHPPLLTAMAEGLRWLARHRLLRTLALLGGFNTFCFQLGNVTLVLLATGELHLSARGYGLLLAGAATGNVAGGLINGRIVARTGALPALLVSLVANVILFGAIGFSPDALVAGALLGASGFVTALWTIVSVSLRQQIVPAELRGRVNSAYRMLTAGLMPFGALAGGLVARELGVRAAYPVAGLIRAIALIIALPVLLAEVRAVKAATRAGPAAQPQGAQHPG
jgi:MFS family permease